MNEKYKKLIENMSFTDLLMFHQYLGGAILRAEEKVKNIEFNKEVKEEFKKLILKYREIEEEVNYKITLIILGNERENEG